MVISAINSVASHCANMIATSTDVCNLLLLYCQRGKVWDTRHVGGDHAQMEFQGPII
jgi:hypothetical protein